MTSQGTAHGRFQRAIQRGHLLAAEMAAREMGTVNLADALRLSLLIAEVEPDRWPRAAARWHSRFVQEASGIGIEEAGLALAAIAALQGPQGELAAQTLQRLAASYGLSAVVALLERR